MTASYQKLPRQEYIISNNPWNSLNKEEIKNLIVRLEDNPNDLYKGI